MSMVIWDCASGERDSFPSAGLVCHQVPLRRSKIDTAAVLAFPYLKAGKYSLRITEDMNGNGQIDTGDLLEHRQPEKVMMFKFNDVVGNNAYIIEIPERTELIQTIDIGEMFR